VVTIPDCPNAPYCCCNEGIYNVLNTISTPIDIRLANNNNSPLSVSTIYKLCNDVVWVQLQGGGNDIAVIPLCSIFSIN
jgi:hypothetical protein